MLRTTQVVFLAIFVVFDLIHVIAILEVYERDIVVYCQMSNFSAISWIEQVNFCMRL